MRRIVRARRDAVRVLSAAIDQRVPRSAPVSPSETGDSRRSEVHRRDRTRRGCAAWCSATSCRVRAVVDWDVAGLRSPILFFVRVHGRSVRGIDECLMVDPQGALRVGGVRRLRRLEDTGLIRICAQVDQEVTDGTGESAYLALRTQNSQVQPIIDDMVERPEFRTVDRTVGEYNVLAYVHAASRAEFADVVDRMRSSPGVERSETWPVASHQLCSFPWARF